MRETHEIHHSERRTFRSCRLRWHWEHKEHLTPNTGVKPLEFGIAFHSALQEFYNPGRWDITTPQEKLDVAMDTLDTIIGLQRQTFLEATGQKNMVGEALGDDYGQRTELARNMLEHYALKEHPKHDNWFRPKMVEIPFRVPLYDPNDLTEPLYCDASPTCGQEHPNPAPMTYDGRVDMIVEDLQHGGLWAWDHKTAGSLLSNDWFLQLDDQITSYVMALELMLNLDIRGFVYAEIMKSVPRPPDRLERKYKGRLFSVDKRTLTDHDLALDTFETYDRPALLMGVYDEYLEYLQGPNAPRFIQRFKVLQSRKKLARVANDIGREAMDMVDPNIRIYAETSRASCNYCQFRDPCVGRLEGEDYGHTLRTLYRVKDDA